MLGCTQNRQKKGAEIAQTEMRKIVRNAESYEPVETKVDSAFTSVYTDEVIVQAAYELIDLNEKKEEIQQEYNRAKSSVAIWQGSWDAFSKEQYRQANEEMQEHASQLNDIENEIEIQNNIINERAKDFEENKFYGWHIYHRFRCANGLGINQISDALIIVDEDMESVIYFFIIDDEDNYSFDKLKKIINKSIDKNKN